jgi:hypothetical protein
MSTFKNLSERWNEFRPTKALWFWSSAGVAAATMVIGFTVGGWVTGGTAQEMAEAAAEKARAELVASVCVERFVSSADFAEQLAALKEANSWDRDEFILEGDWTALVGVEDAVSGAADLCAQRLAEMQAPETKPMAAVPAGLGVVTRTELG